MNGIGISGFKAAAAALGALAVVMALAAPSVALAKVKSNTQVRLPNNQYFGDIDGDGSADFVIPRGGAVFVAKTDFETHAILFSRLSNNNISRLVIGDFTAGGREKGKDQICAILDDNSFACYAISDDKREMWWWFTQGNFIGPDEHAIVGDFNGDGADDILVYKPSAGTARMYTRLSDGFFGLMPNFALGNLTGNILGKELRAGEFGQASGRDDLLVWDRSNGQLMRFDSVTDGAHNETFWWAFTTRAGVVSGRDDLSVANIDGGALDDVVLRDRTTGGYRFYALQYELGGLAPITSVSPGQLPTDTNAMMFWVRNRGDLDAASRRDDQMLYLNGRDMWVSTHARWDGARNTYWWSYTQRALSP